MKVVGMLMSSIGFVVCSNQWNNILKINLIYSDDFSLVEYSYTLYSILRKSRNANSVSLLLQCIPYLKFNFGFGGWNTLPMTKLLHCLYQKTY